MEIIELTPEEALGPLNEREQKNAAKELFCVGDIGLLKSAPRVSMVGSRKVSDLGRTRAKVLAKKLVGEGITVLSGLAEGVDAMSHTSAIQHGGRTIGVIGTPLDKSYPASNRELQSQIARDHLLISQFPIGYPGGRKNFPMRNRTMALLSDATVIIEAKDKSGTLHQGWEALRLGRPLFILESVANDENLEWTEEMISHGASILSQSNLDDLISILPTVSRDELANFSFS